MIKNKTTLSQAVENIAAHLEGEIYFDDNTLFAYKTDASVYKETPLAVAYPRNDSDVKKLIEWAIINKLSLIPRGTGTSLAGQVVGKGVVVDFSKYMNQILEVNTNQGWVLVQPGVVLDQLNQYLKDFKLFFGPETSTSNRCTLGGMVGNNACGAHSLIYGSTRDHLLEVKGYLSDGSFAHFKPITIEEFKEKLKLQNLEGKIYRQLFQILSSKENQKEILDGYPDPSIKRRNTGYAIDQLLYNNVFGNTSEPFNLCKLIAGSEGTLMMITEIKLNLLPLENKMVGLLCAHFHTLEEAIRANVIALTFNPDAIELIDDIIIGCTNQNISQQKNRFFIQGNPGAILLIEFSAQTKKEVEAVAAKLSTRLKELNLGYHFPLFFYPEINRIWELRKAALGLLSNIPGDAKPVSLVEDNAIPVHNLLDYVRDFKALLEENQLNCVFHAHIATGELHTRPVINLKTPEGQVLFRKIGTQTAYLVKKYRGSISGEHGDGRLRSEFIPIIIGEKNYRWCCSIKELWDPQNIFNPGKIVAPVPMDVSLRYKAGEKTPDITTFFDFTASQGFMRHIEQCNGSADCRKLSGMGGIMCPSYRATQNEKMTTRARANVMREIFQQLQEMAFKDNRIVEILSECLSCKGCKSECPSNVDMTKLKAEFLQHYYDVYGVPIRSKLFAFLPEIYKIASYNSHIFNKIINWDISRRILNKLGITPERNFPLLARISFFKWYHNQKKNEKKNESSRRIWVFVDEFTNYLEPQLAQYTLEILTRIGYNPRVLPIMVSGRTYLSKGMVRRAKKIIEKNLTKLQKYWKGEPIVGIEPSALLTIRDEYIDLTQGELKVWAKNVAHQSMTIEEFICMEMNNNFNLSKIFKPCDKEIWIHAHCYQKSLSKIQNIINALSLKGMNKVHLMPTDCCGMAGSFGYEKEHYELSMKIGELSVFPQVRKHANDWICVPGVSCREQIWHATGIRTFHPVEIFYKLLM